MRLILASSDNINGLNGAAKFIRLMNEQRDKFSQAGIEIVLISNSETFKDAEKYNKSLTRIIKQSLKKMAQTTSVGKRWFFFNYFIKKLGYGSMEKLESIIREDDIVLFNDYRIADAFYRRYGNKYTTFFMMHNGGKLLSMLNKEMEDKIISDYLKESQELILHNANCIVFVSETARKVFCNDYPQFEGKSRTIYIGSEDLNQIETSNYTSGSAFNIVTVGTLCERKNQIMLIQAVESIKSDVHLTLVGDGPKYADWNEYCKNKRLLDRIKFVGATKNVEYYLRHSDLFALSSIDEGLPVAAQEAMSVGLPLILTDVGGCGELIDGNGILIHVSLNEMIEAIESLIANNKLREMYGKKSHQLFSEKYSMERMTVRYIELINDYKQKAC